ncbi:MAG: DNA translocase FtsK 4TM domain-containing protein, partial [Flammeovirgaceae bacterium]|nr:DNA translocase FtsK 4TM domain-containing protein [Flammeovirgaceae bacterium]MDW8287063.1 DNA translocase FtsK 4TM domain-containing protein [Flammeovirgaceae bacterium]
MLQTINWEETFRFLQDKRFRISLGLALIFFSLFLFFSILSFLFTGKADQSIVENTYTISSGKEIENWLGLWGAVLSHFFIYKLFGISSILFAPFFFLVGYRVQTGKAPISILRAFTFCIFSMTWLSLAMGYFVEVSASHNAFFFLCGNIGLRLAEVFNSFAGIATIFLLILSLAIFLVYFFELTSWSKFKEDVKSNIENVLNKKDTLKTSEQTTKTSQTKVQEPTPPSSSPSISLPIVPIDLEEKDTAKEKKDKIDFTIEKSTQEPDVPTLYPVRQAVPEEQASPESEVVLESAENQSTDERLEDDAVA